MIGTMVALFWIYLLIQSSVFYCCSPGVGYRGSVKTKKDEKGAVLFSNYFFPFFMLSITALIIIICFPVIVSKLCVREDMMLEVIMFLDFLDFIYMLYIGRERRDSRIYLCGESLMITKKVIIIGSVIHFCIALLTRTMKMYYLISIDIIIVSAMCLFIGTIYANYLSSCIVVYWQCYVDDWRVGIAYKLRRFNLKPEEISRVKYDQNQIILAFDSFNNHHEMKIKMESNKTADLIMELLEKIGVNLYLT